MGTKISIAVLVENSVYAQGLKAEHGLSILVETGAGTVLFDTGQSTIVLDNAHAMGLDLKSVNRIVLSHGHYDHTGGLSGILDVASDAAVHAHPEIFIKRYSRNRKKARAVVPVHIPSGRSEIESKCKSMILQNSVAEILPGVFTTGEIPRVNEFEDTGGSFYIDEGCTAPDHLMDDQALFIDSPRGMIVIAGCAHSGIVNTLDYVASLSGVKRLYAVLGGMHLTRASLERIQSTVDVLKRYKVQVLGPCHCTGPEVIARFRSLFPDKSIPFHTGSAVTFE